MLGVRVMVLNTTFNNNSVISWWSFQYVFFRNKYYLHIYFIATNQQSQILDSNEIPLCLPEYTYNVSLYSYAYLSLKRPQTQISKNIKEQVHKGSNSALSSKHIFSSYSANICLIVLINVIYQHILAFLSILGPKN